MVSVVVWGCSSESRLLVVLREELGLNTRDFGRVLHRYGHAGVSTGVDTVSGVRHLDGGAVHTMSHWHSRSVERVGHRHGGGVDGFGHVHSRDMGVVGHMHSRFVNRGGDVHCWLVDTTCDVHSRFMDRVRHMDGRGVGHVHRTLSSEAVVRGAVTLGAAGADGMNFVELMLVSTEELVAGGGHLVGIRYGDELTADACGNFGSQGTHIAGLTVAVTVVLALAMAVAVGGAARGLMGGNRQHHCQHNLQKAN